MAIASGGPGGVDAAEVSGALLAEDDIEAILSATVIDERGHVS